MNINFTHADLIYLQCYKMSCAGQERMGSSNSTEGKRDKYTGVEAPNIEREVKWKRDDPEAWIWGAVNIKSLIHHTSYITKDTADSTLGGWRILPSRGRVVNFIPDFCR